MTAPLPTPFTPDPDITLARIARLERLAQKAETLADLVLDTATLLADSPHENAERIPPLTHAFESLVRTIRQTVALQHRLETDLARSTTTTHAAAATRNAARRQVIRQIEDAIDARPRTEERTENLLRDLHERLTDPVLDEDLLTRQLDHIVQEIAHDLGIFASLKEHAKHRTAADLIPLHARAAAPARPPAGADPHQLTVPPARDPPSG